MKQKLQQNPVFRRFVENGKDGRRKLFILLISLMLLTAFSRIGASVGGLLKHQESQQETPPTITVLLPQHTLPRESYLFLDRYRRQYETETGVKVNLERIMAANRERYLLRRNTRLYMSEGPALILLSQDEYARELVEAGVALKIGDGIPNQANLYPGLRDDYFVPVKMHGKTVSLNRRFLEQNGLTEPGLEWTLQDHDELWDLWAEKEEVFFNRNLFHAIVTRHLRDVRFIHESGESVQLNTPEVRQLIQEIHDEVFSGKYILQADYRFENYYNMFHVMNSEESQDSWERFIRNSRNNFIMNTVGHHYNGLHSQRSNQVVKYIPTSLLLPDVREDPFHFIGFLVNRNGQHPDLGMEFINYLLSDSIQLDLFEQEAEMENSTNAPVVNTIVESIEAFELRRDILPEAVSLRKAMTKWVENEEMQPLFYGPDLKELKVQQRFVTELINIIFADQPHTEEELTFTLKKMENELTLYLNE